jgi:hypothetical protein
VQDAFGEHTTSAEFADSYYKLHKSRAALDTAGLAYKKELEVSSQMLIDDINLNPY